LYRAWNEWFDLPGKFQMSAFIGKTLTQVRTAPGGQPRSFQWNGECWTVDSVVKEWQDFDHSSLSPKKDWRSRRHRNYFHVLTPSGRSFELYCDRGTKLGAKKTWVLSKELS
jgi:hypothetical protein